MDLKHLRCLGDQQLAERLLAEQYVKRVIARRLSREEDEPGGVRRRLLGTALRLTPSMSPKIGQLIETCRERLEIDLPMETYIYASPQFNAACVRPEAGRLFIMLSSSLLEAFPTEELRFVVGHELGHYRFGHHDIPIGVLLGGKEKPSPELALRLFAWSRYAEISADRAGAWCACDGDAVASALFRLASGLRGDLVEVRIDDFAAQADDMQLEIEDGAQRPTATEWFSTHPFSPLRVKALKHYSDSELACEGGESVELLEAHVQTLMALMEPSYLDERSTVAETMRRLLFAGAIAVADAAGGIVEAEVAVFEKFFGDRSFSDKLDIDAIKKSLPERIADAHDKVPTARRVQVLRDLCLVLRADGRADPRELQVLKDLARGLDISQALVDRTVSANLDPD